jgi:BirA family biotin operon repressor/biotin-[acetyl-CoA-carboxylase] ligase
VAVGAGRFRDKSQGDRLSSHEISQGLRTRFLGRHLVYLPEVESTNEVARRLGQEGAAEGTLVIADYQSGGRGRLGRSWQAPPGSSLLFSLLFRPPLAPALMQRLTMACGLAVAEAIEVQTGLDVGLKWPNDVMIGGQKTGGILTELELRGSVVEFAVVGIGLNVNLDPEALAALAEDPRPSPPLAEYSRPVAEYSRPATSLSHALGRPVPRLPLLLALLDAAEARYLALCQGHSPYQEWAERLTTLGHRVVVSGAARPLEGVAEGVDADGALQLRLDDGRLETVLAGDVSLRSSA